MTDPNDTNSPGPSEKPESSAGTSPGSSAGSGLKGFAGIKSLLRRLRRPRKNERLLETLEGLIEEREQEAETAGGYAKEMSNDFKQKQAKLVAETLVKQDIVITTALIPGRPAPILVTEEMVRSMKPGSVIVDLAAPQGGNCALTQIGKTIDINGVKILGFENISSHIATDSSALYARNLMNLLAILVDKNGDLVINMDDEIIKATVLTKSGRIVHPGFQ